MLALVRNLGPAKSEISDLLYFEKGLDPLTSNNRSPDDRAARATDNGTARTTNDGARTGSACRHKTVKCRPNFERRSQEWSR